MTRSLSRAVTFVRNGVLLSFCNCVWINIERYLGTCLYNCALLPNKALVPSSLHFLLLPSRLDRFCNPRVRLTFISFSLLVPTLLYSVHKSHTYKDHANPSIRCHGAPSTVCELPRRAGGHQHQLQGRGRQEPHRARPSAGHRCRPVSVTSSLSYPYAPEEITIVCLTCRHSVTRLASVQRFLYANAGFSKLAAIDGLSDEPWRFDVSGAPPPTS